MKKILFIIIIFLFLSSNSLYSNSSTISGIIRDINSFRPISNAIIRVGNEIAISNKYGEFSTDLEMEGQYIISAEAEGYESKYKQIRIFKGENAINFKLNKKKKSWNLFGTVYDRILKQPVENAKISVDGIEAVTNSDGQFTFNNVLPGQRWITVYKKGYKGLRYKVSINNQNCKINLFLDHEGNISQVYGEVFNRLNSLPLKLAIVEINGRRATTNNNGYFLIPNLLPGEYKITISCDGYFKYYDKIKVTPGNINIKVYLEPYDLKNEIKNLKEAIVDPSRVDWNFKNKTNKILIHKNNLPTTQYSNNITLKEKDNNVRERLLKRLRFKRKIIRKNTPVSQKIVKRNYRFSTKFHEKIKNSKTDKKIIKNRKRIVKKNFKRVYVTKSEYLVKGKIFIGETGEYIGNISFVIDTDLNKIRNISLRALPNTRGLSLTKAKYKFTKKGNRYRVMVRLSYYEGNSLIAISKKINKFKLYLYRDQPPLGVIEK